MSKQQTNLTFILLRPVTLIVVLCCCVMYFSRPTFAESSLSISPPVNEILISPTKSIRIPLTFTNNGTDDTFTLSLHSVTPADSHGHSLINPQPLDLASIPITISVINTPLSTPFTLKTGETKDITLEVHAANVDAAQDVYFALLAQTVDISDSPNDSLASTAITSLFLTTITPTDGIATDISFVTPQVPTLHDNTLPLDLKVTAKNQANTMLQTKLKITLTSPSKNIISESTLDPSLILAHSDREINPPPLLFHPTNIGPHLLTLELTTIGGRSLATHTTVIWLLPIRYLLVLVATLLLLLTIPIVYKFRLTSRVKKT